MNRESFKRNFKQSAAGVAILLCAVGCGKDREVTTISGVATKDTLIGSKVTAYLVNPDGSPGAKLGAQTTDEAGNYRIEIPTQINPSQTPILIVATGGSYLHPDSGATIPLSAPLMAFQANANKQSFSLSAQTYIASQRTLDQLKTGVPLQAAVISAHIEVAIALGVPSITIPPKKKLTPKSTHQAGLYFFLPSAYADDSLASPAEQLMALSLAGMEKELARNATAGGDLMTVLASVAHDFASDGKIDGKLADGTAIPLSIDMGHLQTAIQAVKDGDVNKIYEDAPVPTVVSNH